MRHEESRSGDKRIHSLAAGEGHPGGDGAGARTGQRDEDEGGSGVEAGSTEGQTKRIYDFFRDTTALYLIVHNIDAPA